MSLLLDAMKKSGEKQQGTGLSNMKLEDAPPRSTATSSASASRAAGDNLFAAKKKKSASFQWNLGLVPSTLLFALIFGSGYGYYVWREIQPPPAPLIQRSGPPPAPLAPQIATRPLVTAMPPQDGLVQPLQTRTEPPAITARNEEFDAPRNPPVRTVVPNTPKPRAATANVQHKLTTDSASASVMSAYQAYQRGDYATAAQEYRQVLAGDSHNRDALMGLAAIAQQQGHDETAQQYYKQLLALDPRDPVAQAAMSSYAADSGNRESQLKLLLAEQPRSGALNFALGNYYADISSWGDAQQYYFNAVAAEPANAQYAYNLAISLDHLGQRKQAAQYYQQALQLDTNGKSGFDHEQAQRRLNALTPAN